MGRRLFQEVYASQDRTDALGLPDLMVVSEADDPETADSIYHAVHKSYFSKEKQICPYCQGANTAETKIRSRKFKDILPSANGNRKVIDERQINDYLALENKPSGAMASAVMGILDSLEEMVN